MRGPDYYEREAVEIVKRANELGHLEKSTALAGLAQVYATLAVAAAISQVPMVRIQ